MWNFEGLKGAECNVDIYATEETSAEFEAERIRREIEACGHTWVARVNPATGIVEHKPFLCKHSREKHGMICENCARNRAYELEMRIHDAFSNGKELWWNRVEVDEAKKIVRKYGRDSVLSLPQEDDSVVVFWSVDENVLEGEEITDVADIADMDWGTLARTPVGRRISGGLGKEPPVADSDCERVRIDVYVSTLGENEIESAAIMALAETQDLLPIGVDELQEALDKRALAYRRAVVRLGGRIVKQIRTTAIIDIAGVDWSIPERLRCKFPEEKLII